LAQLIGDAALIPDALEECLRLGSNGYFTFPRIATRDTEVGGTPILKGMVVRPSPLAPNYDPDVFPDPTSIDVHRRPKRILSFGCGDPSGSATVSSRMPAQSISYSSPSSGGRA
jgi:cytochrome P450